MTTTIRRHTVCDYGAPPRRAWRWAVADPAGWVLDRGSARTRLGARLAAARARRALEAEA